MSPDPRSPDERAGNPRWAGRAALAFVLLTLVSLVVVPVLVQRRVAALRAEIESSEPARTLATRLGFNLVREMAALSELALTGSPQSTRIYAAAREEERAIIEELAPLAGALGPEVEARYREVRRRAEAWHARIAEERVVPSDDLAPRELDIPREEALFEEVLRSAAAMDSTILRTTAATRSRIVEAERTGLRLTVLLGLLALLSAAVVAVLEGRVRRYAAEAERGREEAELRQRQAEIALAEAARADEARARLLRGVTHDVKNPLGAAKGYVELIEMGIRAPMPPEQAPLVAGVRRSVDGALAIIADLLDLARADSGGLTVQRVPTDLGRVAREAVEDHRPAAETTGHEIDFAPPAEPVEVYTDPARVRQVLGNLLSNAIKYTPSPGRITVRAELVEEGAGPRPGTWAVVRVSDTGPGIPEGQREAVFDEFTRLDDAAETKGHGLGLAIARRIARLLDGDLALADPPAPGATFLLWLPRRTVKSEK